MSLEVQVNQVPIDDAVNSEEESGSWEIVPYPENASNTDDNISEPEPDEKMSVPEPPSELDTLEASITGMGISKELFDLAVDKMGKISNKLQNTNFVLNHIWRISNNMK